MVSTSTEATPQTVVLTVHAVVPKGENVTVEVFNDRDQTSLPVIENLKIASGFLSTKTMTPCGM